MKKLAILFLLTAVVVSFSFAEVSLTTEFSISNINKGNDVRLDPNMNTRTAGDIGYADPVLKFLFEADASKDLGPGALKLSGAVGVANSFHDSDYDMNQGLLGGVGAVPTDDLKVVVGYYLPVGPGTLGFSVANKFDPKGPKPFGATETYTWTLEPGIGYTDINLGAVTLGAKLMYDYKYNGISTDNATAVPKTAAFFRPYGDSMSADTIIFRLDVGTGFGLSVGYEFTYGWGKDATGRASWAKQHRPVNEWQGQREIKNIAMLDINYAIAQAVSVGLVIDDTGPAFRGNSIQGWANGSGTTQFTQYNTETKGFSLKPKASFTLGDIGLGAYVKFENIMPTNVDQEIHVTPGVTVKYTM